MSLVWRTTIALLVAYLPGALLYRLPVAHRERRASLPAEERVFWGVILSVVITSLVALGLAAAGRYRFERLLWIDAGVCAAMVVAARGRLRLGPGSAGPRLTALIPLALIGLGLWADFSAPPAEYIIGGKDPGIYINEGIRIAQRGALVFSDDLVRAVPPPFQGLFFRPSPEASYESNRFMGFFVLKLSAGTVVGQFPHLYPVWIAIAYGIHGLTGAREAAGVLGLLGVLAVYFAGSRIVSRSAAAIGAGLLTINVIQIWYARYPNAEILLQPLVFAGLLAYVRANVDGDRFFAPIAALLVVLGVFTHLSGVFAVACLAAVSLLMSAGRRLDWSFWIPLVLGTALAGIYLARYIPPYFDVPRGFVQNLRWIDVAFISVVSIAAVGLWARARRVPAYQRLRVAHVVLTIGVVALATYAYFFRSSIGRLAPHDADSLRTFTAFYLSRLGLAAALAGFVILATSPSEETLAFLVLAAGFSLVFFYKIRIVPEHFWAARRFLAVTLPSALLMVGAAACGGGTRFAFDSRLPHASALRRVRYSAGLIVVVFLAVRYSSASSPVFRHVEYAGLIPHLEQLSGAIGDKDLVIVESRGASDAHVLALPLAYVYARNVLVLASVDPDKATFRAFLDWAHARYERVFFAGGGGGGTELLSRNMSIKAVRGERFQVPEYDSPVNAYPQGVRFKEFELSLYEFLRGPTDMSHFALDVGSTDDLYVRRFFAKEQSPTGFTFRWTRDTSYVSIVGTRPDQHELILWMSDGGRPPAAGPAAVTLFLNDRPLGEQTIGAGMYPYRFSIPADAAAAMAESTDAAQLRIVTRTWIPKAVGIRDDRELGVMVDRVEIQ